MAQRRSLQFRSELLPFHKRRTGELEKLAAEMFLAGLSTSDVARVLERHFGERFDSMKISRMADGVAMKIPSQPVARDVRCMMAYEYYLLGYPHPQ